MCEHASAHIPAGFDQLGLSDRAARSHIAWDPGALPVAEFLSRQMAAVLVQGTISRLVYDCNRPPGAPSAIPTRSEVFDIPGNRDLTPEERGQRIATVYQPFADAVAAVIARHRASLKLMVTVHSFTPVFHDIPREVELGILHGRDAGFAEAMMRSAPQDGRFCIRMNEPYSAVDGVAHTLDLHGVENDLPNVMIEIRNDLISTTQQQSSVAQYLTDWVSKTLAAFTQQGNAA